MKTSKKNDDLKKNKKMEDDLKNIKIMEYNLQNNLTKIKIEDNNNKIIEEWKTTSKN